MYVAETMFVKRDERGEILSEMTDVERDDFTSAGKMDETSGTSTEWSLVEIITNHTKWLWSPRG